jgi:hypothetical protein
VEWVAYLKDKVPGAQTGEVKFPNFDKVACQTINFAPMFASPPYLQATINHHTAIQGKVEQQES